MVRNIRYIKTKTIRLQTKFKILLTNCLKISIRLTPNVRKLYKVSFKIVIRKVYKLSLYLRNISRSKKSKIMIFLENNKPLKKTKNLKMQSKRQQFQKFQRIRNKLRVSRSKVNSSKKLMCLIYKIIHQSNNRLTKINQFCKRKQLYLHNLHF